MTAAADELVLPAPFTTGEVLVRENAVEVTDVNEERGLVDVRVMTYEREAEIGDQLFEIFSRGAFRSVVGNASRVKISDQQHQMAVVVGQAVELREEGDELLGKLRIADTRAGQDLLKLITPGKDGEPAILSELSIEFRTQPRWFKAERIAKGLLVRHAKAVLIGISPVRAGAHGEGSRILAVREEARNRAQERAIAELAAMTAGTEELTRLR